MDDTPVANTTPTPIVTTTPPPVKTVSNSTWLWGFFTVFCMVYTMLGSVMWFVQSLIHMVYFLPRG